MVWKYLFGSDPEQDKKQAKPAKATKKAKNEGFWAGDDKGEVKGVDTTGIADELTLEKPFTAPLSTEDLAKQAEPAPEGAVISINETPGTETLPSMPTEGEANPAPAESDTTLGQSLTNLIEEEMNSDAPAGNSNSEESKPLFTAEVNNEEIKPIEPVETASSPENNDSAPDLDTTVHEMEEKANQLNEVTEKLIKNLEERLNKTQEDTASIDKRMGELTAEQSGREEAIVKDIEQQLAELRAKEQELNVSKERQLTDLRQSNQKELADLAIEKEALAKSAQRLTTDIQQMKKALTTFKQTKDTITKTYVPEVEAIEQQLDKKAA